jgi:hypothetical protein
VSDRKTYERIDLDNGAFTARLCYFGREMKPATVLNVMSGQGLEWSELWECAGVVEVLLLAALRHKLPLDVAPCVASVHVLREGSIDDPWPVSVTARLEINDPWSRTIEVHRTFRRSEVPTMSGAYAARSMMSTFADQLITPLRWPNDAQFWGRTDSSEVEYRCPPSHCEKIIREAAAELRAKKKERLAFDEELRATRKRLTPYEELRAQIRREEERLIIEGWPESRLRGRFNDDAVEPAGYMSDEAADAIVDRYMQGCG